MLFNGILWHWNAAAAAPGACDCLTPCTFALVQSVILTCEFVLSGATRWLSSDLAATWSDEVAPRFQGPGLSGPGATRSRRAAPESLPDTRTGAGGPCCRSVCLFPPRLKSAEDIRVKGQGHQSPNTHARTATHSERLLNSYCSIHADSKELRRLVIH